MSKRPREPKLFKYPRIYINDCDVLNVLNTDDQPMPRFRILYPDGTCEFTFGCRYLSDDYFYELDGTHVNNSKSCFSTVTGDMGNEDQNKYTTGKQVLKAMRAFDRFFGLPKAIFLGEIK